ncbi:major capsid protein [uncultured Senegalimassilia sp.]|uniref:Major capsid protein n=1 Tax=Siphoviridae sp. ctqBc4 TaxID=2827945 RepID=A0A8S5SC79_9CAUD|nr:hypothetical protein [uncultured Senegalimassilia sp.]DAF48573.1 MAG TPA: major capsid protein [Siphoviridae sp. ctqBc4]
MAITLAEAKVGMADKVDQQVVDMFRRSSYLLDNLVFDNAVSPGTNGSTLTYGYIQLKTPSTAKVRSINSEYTADYAKREKKTADCAIMGGSFEVDRVIQNTSGAIDEMAFQAEQKIKATANYFHNLVINGAKAASPGAGFVGGTFDGLNKLCANTSTEIESEVDVSTPALMDSNKNAFLDELDTWLSTMDGTPTMLLMNTKMLARLRGIARRCGYFERAQDAFGRPVDTYNGIPLIDAGKYYDGSNTVDVIADAAASSTAAGTSDIYAINVALDGFCGFSPVGTGVISSYMPDMTQPGAVKKGEVELVAGVALKNTLKAGHLKGIKTTPQTK